MLDGFELLDEAACVGRNVQPYRNAFSPYSRVDGITQQTPGGKLLVDTFYGLAYDLVPEDDSAMYGLTAELPADELDDSVAKDLGFLRLPFARIPRIRVSSRSQLEEYLDRVPRRTSHGKLLLRGQNREYALPRKAGTLSALYGDSNAVEPSLSPSAARRGLDLDSVLPEWSALLSGCLDEWMHHSRATQSEVESLHDFKSHYLFRRFAAGTAQHYGLPSAGLDVTDQLDIALFFALRRLQPVEDRTGSMHCTTVPDDSTPVIYAFESHPARVASEYAVETPLWLPSGRPDRQHAHFLHRGWGLSQNESARWLAAAFYIDAAADFGALPSAAELFPPGGDDWIAMWIRRVSDAGHGSSELGRFLSFFYEVV